MERKREHDNDGNRPCGGDGSDGRDGGCPADDYDVAVLRAASDSRAEQRLRDVNPLLSQFVPEVIMNLLDSMSSCAAHVHVVLFAL